MNKARRGELITHVPIGYVIASNGAVVLDPDQQAPEVVKLIFGKFDELGTAMSLLRYLHNHDIRLPIRPIHGANKGQIEWRRPGYSTVVNMLHNPTDAGSYAHGRYQIDPRRRTTKKDQGRFRAQIDEWKVLIHDKLPAYITWNRYLANIQRLEGNCSQFDTAGVVREGESLLAGIPADYRTICRRSGHGTSAARN